MDLGRREDAATAVAAAITGDGERVRPHVAAILKAVDAYDSELPAWYAARMLATATHESMMGRWMRELGSFDYFRKYRTILGNRNVTDAFRYRGGGYVHLTGLSNYRKQQERTGHPLVKNPKLAAEPEIAAELLVHGMMTGGFTGKKLADFYPDHTAARAVVNGDVRKNGALIAGYARRYERALKVGGGDFDQTTIAQELLREIGWSVVVDGDFGPATKRAVKWFQQGWTYHDLEVDGIPGPLTMRALRDCVRREGRCSENFKFSEFWDSFRGSREGGPHRELVRYLEKFRAVSGRPVMIVSGFRSRAHQQYLYDTLPRGVAARPGTSTHETGYACDIYSRVSRVSVPRARQIDERVSIGKNRSTGYVSHIDVRWVAGKGTSTWTYNR